MLFSLAGKSSASRLIETTPTRFVFEREGATNVPPNQAVLTRLVLSIEADALMRTEVYVDRRVCPKRA